MLSRGHCVQPVDVVLKDETRLTDAELHEFQETYNVNLNASEISETYFDADFELREDIQVVGPEWFFQNGEFIG